MKNINLVPVYDGNESTVMGYNGTCPESPDGKRLCYTKVKEFSLDRNKSLPIELWVCDVDLENHRKIANALSNMHNGADASWVDNEHIVFQEPSSEGITQFLVMNVNSREVIYGPISASLGHQAEKYKIPFAVKEQHVKHNNNTNIDEAGIYHLDMKNLKIEKLASMSEIYDFIAYKGYTLIGDSSASHIQLNPSADKVMFRLVLEECKVIVTKDLVNNDFFIIPNKPLHQLWFDDDTIIAVNKNDKSDRKIYQYDLIGNQMELLAGKGNHIDFCSDKKWYVSDNFYHEAPVIINLYKRNETEPIVVLDSSEHIAPVWEGRAHANPVFSRDGNRVYFVHAVSDQKVEVVYADISELK